ncbi:MAG: RES family NAD+ phosphorylase [Trueperaceae bacterium]|nr:RES family NAD+ phosphorylase [Trueperaceae bacterium]
MILFRVTQGRYPFMWETPAQPAGRWHAAGNGPVHYFATTIDGAWAELIRHEEITDPEDIAGLRAALWVIDVPDDQSLAEPVLAEAILTGGTAGYPVCQAEAKRLREAGSDGLIAPSAALAPTGAACYRVDGGLIVEPVVSRVVALFGPRPDLRAQRASVGGRPPRRVLDQVRRLSGRSVESPTRGTGLPS